MGEADQDAEQQEEDRDPPAAEVPPWWGISGERLARWRARLLVPSRPRHLLGGALPAPFRDKPRRALLPPDLDDPQAW